MAFALVLNGCDDGDLISQDIDFSDLQLQRCGTTNTNVLYKLTDRDALILQFENLDTFLPDVPSAEGTYDSIVIDNNFRKLLYRVYNGQPATDNICASIQPPTPSVIEQWNATSGMIRVTTSVLKSANGAEAFLGGEKIDGLRYAFTIRDVIWQTPNNSITDDINLGYIDKTGASFTSAATLADVNADTFKCDANNIVYRKSGSQAFAINIDPALLDPTVLNTPKVGTISAGTNAVVYTRYPAGTDLNATGFNFCASYPTLPYSDYWIADAGDGTTTGIIEVISTTVGTSVVHSIRLKNTTLRRQDGAFSFKIADDYLFGELTVSQ